MTNTLHHVLLVGQLYLDTILHVDHFPEEDSKLRANKVEQRLGGNTCNTAQVLAQFHPTLQVHYLSAVGSRESSDHMMDRLQEIHIQTKDTTLYRNDTIIPSSIIVHSQQTSSRTIISHNDMQDITCDEFKTVFQKINTSNQWWVHFEGRNIDHTVQQIKWLDEKATKEQWRHQLVLSVELEKPERPHIELLLEKADVVFFSKVYAQHYHYTDAASFLSAWKPKLKPGAKAYCTWGSSKACVLDNHTNEVHVYQPEAPGQVMDTVGAGDTFNAGVIASLAQDISSSASKSLAYACGLASKKVMQKGFEYLI